MDPVHVVICLAIIGLSFVVKELDLAEWKDKIQNNRFRTRSKVYVNPLNIPEGEVYTHRQIFDLCYERAMFRTMFQGFYPGNEETFEEMFNKRHRQAIIFAVQNTADWYNTQDQIIDW